MDEDSWWYGKGEIGSVVFDQSIQLGDESVLLYVLEKNDVEKYVAEEVRLLLQKESDHQKVEALVKKYRSWKKFYSSRLKKLIKVKPYSFVAVKKEAENEHRSKLEKLGLPFKGISFNSKKSHRATHCWDCKEALDSYIDLECNACGWILCKCGACGCGYSKGT